MSAFDFRAQQQRSRRQSGLLVLAFVAVVAVIGVTIGVIAAALLAAEETGAEQFDPSRVDPSIAGGVAALVFAVVSAAALFRILSLGGDGARVARALGGEEVTEDTRNPYNRRYLNVVEEMAIAAGLPRPRAFVIRHESGINAFAAGSDPQRAAVGVTHGALAKLDREELAGVVAHEMSHIANRDTRLNVRLMGMVFGLVALYVIGRGLLRSMMFARGRRDNRGAAPAVVIGLALVVLGLLGVLAGRVLQSAVSRRREYLADATGVQFTRNPAGLAGALKKIGATADGARVRNAHAEEARHMFFACATGSATGLFDTHPPLIARIRALEPQFDPATDSIWNSDERAILREARPLEEMGPWERVAG